MQYILLLGTAGLLIASLTKNLKSFSDNLRVYVSIAGLPKLTKGDMQLPVRVRIDNPEAQAFKLTDLFLTAYKKTPGGATYLASTAPLSAPFVLKAKATSEFTVVVRLPIQDAAIEAVSVIQSFISKNPSTKAPSVDDYLIKGSAKIDGITIPIDTSTQNQAPQ
jgi:hypothetical protein